jgi:hypothetical protein
MICTTRMTITFGLVAAFTTLLLVSGCGGSNGGTSTLGTGGRAGGNAGTSGGSSGATGLGGGASGGVGGQGGGAGAGGRGGAVGSGGGGGASGAAGSALGGSGGSGGRGGASGAAGSALGGSGGSGGRGGASGAAGSATGGSVGAGGRGGAAGLAGNGGAVGVAGRGGANGGTSGAGGSVPCGTITCTSGEVCLQYPCVDAPPCYLVPPDGGCPSGTTFNSSCGLTIPRQPGCQGPACPTDCAARPTSCSDPLTCSCLGNSICGNTATMCTAVSGLMVTCQ